MLNNIKLVTLVIYFIITCGYIVFLRADNNSIKSELQKQTIILKAAQVLRDNQEAQLKRAEKEAQSLRLEVLKQIDKINNAKIRGGCEGAFNWMIEQV